MMKIGRPQLEFCRVQKIPTDVYQHKKGPEKIENATPIILLVIYYWAPHKPKIKIDQKALINDSNKYNALLL